MKNIFVVTVILLSSGLAYAAQWKLQELARASNAIVSEMDQLLAHKKAPCGLDATAISQSSQNLKALIDQRVSELNGKSEDVIKLLKSCSQDCTCETYEYALEKLTGSEKYQSSKNLSSTDRKLCRTKLVDFCKSKLFKAIR